MGFPVAYSEFTLPKLFINLLLILGFIRKLIIILFSYVGLSNFLEPNNPLPQQSRTQFSFVSASLVREILHVVRFSELVNPPESCAICLHEFEAEDEIRPLTNCCHIFHRTCLDPWIGYEQKTCPLCRKSLVSCDMMKQHSASGMSESYDEFSHAELIS